MRPSAPTRHSYVRRLANQRWQSARVVLTCAGCWMLAAWAALATGGNSSEISPATATNAATTTTTATTTATTTTTVVRPAGLKGHYLEARTCQVYTGPCFANGEVGLTGRDAVLAWKVDEGSLAGVDLSGLGVAMVVRASDTLGFAGFEDGGEMKSMIIVDQRADSRQRDALVEFVRTQVGQAAGNLKSVSTDSFDLEFNLQELTAKLQIGKRVTLETRKARPTDCICSNEKAYYPPLVPLQGAVPGVTQVGEISARPLGTRWSIPDTRTAYLGRFDTNEGA